MTPRQSTRGGPRPPGLYALPPFCRFSLSPSADDVAIIPLFNFFRPPRSSPSQAPAFPRLTTPLRSGLCSNVPALEWPPGPTTAPPFLTMPPARSGSLPVLFFPIVLIARHRIINVSKVLGFCLSLQLEHKPHKGFLLFLIIAQVLKRRLAHDVNQYNRTRYNVTT